jgi:CRISPR-associated endonuclease Cas3-HD
MFSPDWINTADADFTSSSVSNQTVGSSGYDVSGFQIARNADHLEYRETRAAFHATQTEDGEWSLLRLGGIPDNTYQPEHLPNVDLQELKNFAAAHKWRFLLKLETLATDVDPDVRPSALMYFGKALQKNDSRTVLFVDEHVTDVSAGAKKLAECAGLPHDLVVALEKAGELHDLGKNEPIWQKVAGNLRPDGTFVKVKPVAKPIKVMHGRDLGGFRHELASLRYAEKKIEDQNISPELRDLVLHLIAAHHGHARPCFEKQAYDRNYLRDSARVALDTPQRFAKLQQKYGAWGLAYLESILRAADGIASNDSAAEEQPANA